MSTQQIFGMIMAGGQSRRMGGVDKALLRYGDQSLLEHVYTRLKAQVPTVMINANKDFALPGLAGVPCRADVLAGFLGPLAGLLTGMEWAREQGGDNAWITTVAVDTPLFPDDLVERLMDGVVTTGHQAALASSGGVIHPVFGVWSVSLSTVLRQALEVDNIRKVMDWVQMITPAFVDWTLEGQDPFTNINSPDQLALVTGCHLP